MKRLIGILVAAGMAVLATESAHAQAQARTEVGILDCTVAGGVGLILGSNKAVTCTFYPADGINRAPEVYQGQITKIGLDIGVTQQTFIKWLVLAPSTSFPPHSLSGRYVGASGEATLGVGLGANALVGGSDRTFALQPFSVQAQTGLNLAVGVASLTLR